MRGRRVTCSTGRSMTTTRSLVDHGCLGEREGVHGVLLGGVDLLLMLSRIVRKNGQKGMSRGREGLCIRRCIFGTWAIYAACMCQGRAWGDVMICRCSEGKLLV